MEIVSSWKNSLVLLRWKNLKEFVRTVLRGMPDISWYWFKYSFWSLALIIGTMLVYSTYSYAMNTTVFLFIISLLTAHVIVILCFIIKSVLHHEPFELSKYKKHVVYGTCFLSIVFLLVLFDITFPFLPRVKMEPYRFAQMLKEYLAAGKKLVLFLSVQNEGDIIMHAFKVTVRDFFIFVPPIAFFMSFIVFSFLDMSASIKHLLMSIVRSIKFIIYTLPFLVVYYGVILVTGIGFFMLYNLFFNYLTGYTMVFKSIFDSILLIGLVFWIFPFLITIKGELYKRLKPQKGDH